MKFQSHSLALFLLAIISSFLMLFIGFQNLCSSGGGWINIFPSCSDKTPTLFFVGIVFPFFAFPLCALICRKLTKEDKNLEMSSNRVIQNEKLSASNSKNSSLLFLSTFPIITVIFLVLIIVFIIKVNNRNKSAQSTISKRIENPCLEKQTFKNEISQTPLKVRVLRVKSSNTYNKNLSVEFTIAINNLPKSINKFYFDLNFANEKEEGLNNLSTKIMNPHPPISITQNHGQITFNTEQRLIKRNGRLVSNNSSSNIFRLRKNIKPNNINEELPLRGIYSLSTSAIQCKNQQIHKYIDLPKAVS